MSAVRSESARASRLSRALLTAVHHAADQTLVDDPVVQQVLTEVGTRASPITLVQALAGTAHFAREQLRLMDAARGSNGLLDLGAMRTEMFREGSIDGDLVNSAFAVLAATDPQVPDRSPQPVIAREWRTWGYFLALTLCVICLRILNVLAERSPGLTRVQIMEKWALLDERSIGHPTG